MPNKKPATPNKRIFDTDNALKGSFNGRFGKWQLLTYVLLIFAYANVNGWIARVQDYNLLSPTDIDCAGFDAKYKRDNNTRRVIQRLTGLDKYDIKENNVSIKLNYNYSNTYGRTVITEFHLFCDLLTFTYLPRYMDLIGLIVGSLLLGFLSDKGGRKIILLGCIWVTGWMSIFQVVGKDFISYVFFQIFTGIFVGGVNVVFLPTIVEMFPINLRTFYGVFFHLVVVIFQLLLPLIAKAFLNWSKFQFFITLPLLLTAPLQWIAFESIFWYLAHKEYDQAIQTLTKLAKRNGILFESKFKEAKEFLHAKHSKAIQIDLLPLLRLKDLEQLGKKYPTVDMTELQKQKVEGSNIRRFLNSLKGNHYRSTNTIYYPFDFIYSPTMLVYVFILCGLWFTNGLTESIESVKFKIPSFDVYINDTLFSFIYIASCVLAIVFSLLRISRRWMIFAAYIVVELCLLTSLLSRYKDKEFTEKAEFPLKLIYVTCKFGSHFGLIFLMLLTAELFPTSLRCTGMGICFSMKLFGKLIASDHMLNYNGEMHRLVYGLLVMIFGVLALFLPETRNFPLPRSILQIEAMPTMIGKKLRSRKVKIACDQRRRQFNKLNNDEDAKNVIYYNNKNNVTGNTDEIALLCTTNTQINTTYINDNNKKRNNSTDGHYAQYDTVSSVHDIEQDAHIYYREQLPSNISGNSNTKLLPNIAEVPSKNITRNNSIVDTSEYSNSKV